jgi:hypothetical protein
MEWKRGESVRAGGSARFGFFFGRVGHNGYVLLRASLRDTPLTLYLSLYKDYILYVAFHFNRLSI